MVANAAADDNVYSLSNLPATSLQRRIVFAVAGVLLAAFAITVPFAGAQLPPFVSFNPSVESIVFVNDLVTSILLYSQYAITRSRAILALAIGYFYTALIVVPHILTFPGAFTGLLGAGPQTSAWLYYFWSAGTPMAVIVYALLGNADRAIRATARSTQSIIVWSIVLVIGLVMGITWLTTAGDRFLPSLMSGDYYSNRVVYVANPLAILIAVIAFAVLWSRRRSILDYWLLLAMFSLILNCVVAAVLARQRYSLGFYASRGFTLVTSMVVLALLLREMTNLYTRLARSNMMLQRERQNKLMNLEAMAASIAHEVKQPLTGITASGSAILRFLRQTPPNLARAESAVNTMIVAGQNADQILDNIRALFGKAELAKDQIDVNGLALDVFRALDSDFKSHHIATNLDLAPRLPPIMANKVQLQEVIINLVHNAIEAMDLVDDDHRMLKLGTQLSADNTITITVEDTGPGFDPEKLDAIFDPFVTTKPHGMGLGLAICRTIVERHEGQLSASSATPHGVIFRITLPRTNLTF
jgi:signal transduction histidine kinase